MLQNVDEFVEAHKGLSKKAFCARYDHPFLLLIVDSLGEGAGDFVTMGSSLGGGMNDSGSGCYVAPVVKQVGKRDSRSMVTLGRTANTDITIHNPVLSKLHCLFRKTPEGEMTIADVKSTNGTTLNGKELEKNKPIPIKSGDELTFGEKVSGTYLYPEDLFARLGLGGKTRVI